MKSVSNCIMSQWCEFNKKSCILHNVDKDGNYDIKQFKLTRGAFSVEVQGLIFQTLLFWCEIHAYSHGAHTECTWIVP